MKKPFEHEDLLRDVLAEGRDARAVTLRQGLTALRCARVRRRAIRLGLAASPAVLLMVLWLARHPLGTPRPTDRAEPTTEAVTAPPIRRIAGTPIRIISDEELLAVFQGRPVALLGEPGHQRLVLLDEANSNR
jgi:hypothetical protein